MLFTIIITIIFIISIKYDSIIQKKKKIANIQRLQQNLVFPVLQSCNDILINIIFVPFRLFYLLLNVIDSHQRQRKEANFTINDDKDVSVYKFNTYVFVSYRHYYGLIYCRFLFYFPLFILYFFVYKF